MAKYSVITKKSSTPAGPEQLVTMVTAHENFRRGGGVCKHTSSDNIFLVANSGNLLPQKSFYFDTEGTGEAQNENQAAVGFI
ncbi:MAG TPA: hypothetical protein VHY08_01505 [Bacillota bacterium]|nr:hypothetical protein [Bacillota bacterium]